MGNFFTSEMVRGDMQEMASLQEYCMKSMYAFPALSPEKKAEYFTNLRKLIEKQQIFYARLKLSDDPEAKYLLDSLKSAAQMFGASPQENVDTMFDELLSKIDHMKEILEAEGG
tara:strand:- start:613 stop:954 length:342 start_codon:yes stop_codon:yes gene_type:complete